MKCLDRNLTNRQVFERIDKYSRGELTPKHAETFEKHFWKCSACYEALIMHRLTLKVVKEYGNEIFSGVVESPREKNERITLWLVRDQNKKMRVILTPPNYGWSAAFFNPTRNFELSYKTNKSIWNKSVHLFGRTRALHAPSPPDIEVVQLTDEAGAKKTELVISLEQKQDRVILSIAKKNPRSKATG